MHKKYDIPQITNLLDCKVVGQVANQSLNHLCIDSRHINIAENTLFIALIGARFNGHNYIQQCIKEGIQLFLISDESFIPNDLDKNILFLIVEDTLDALQQIAAFHRKNFSYPVIGITGSNGKTIIKEWLYQLLQPVKRVIKSPKSYNSQVGVPLSVWNMSPEDEIAIFEAGISLPNEMNRLQKIIAPNMGIFTNIGPAHDEGFQNIDEKIENKLLLFAAAIQIIYCKDHPSIDKHLKKNQKTISWGLSADSDYQFAYDRQDKHTIILVKHEDQAWSFQVNFTDAISLENVSHVITTALTLNIESDIIEENLRFLRNIAMRMELKYGLNNCLIIDDSYSADMLSFEAGLNFLEEQKGNLKPTLIISPFDQSGQSHTIQISLLKQLIQKRKIHKLIVVGDYVDLKENYLKMAEEVMFFTTTADLLNNISNISFNNEAILVKGGRKYHFEKIVSELQAKSHKTILEINLNKLIDNLNFYRSRLPKATGIIAMVKAYSYGSGSTEIAYTLQTNKVDYLAVAYADEGVQLRKNGVYIPIIVMNPSIDDLDIMINSQLEPSVYSLDLLTSLLQSLDQKNISEFKIHLKFETGMTRLGISEAEIPLLIEQLKRSHKLVIASIFSHLAAADDEKEREFSLQQIDKLEQIHSQLKSHFGNLSRHILNSAGIISFPNLNYEYVRLGIGLYGIDSTNTCQDKLQFISTLKTRITQIKTVEKGESIGYGRSDIAVSRRIIAVLAIGYADGYDRRFSNGNGKVFLNGHFAPTIGRICMDMSMVDITGINNVKTGQFVEVFGEHVSIIEAAETIGTISYELLTNISERVKRIYTWE